MKPAAFEYHRPNSLEEALLRKAANEDDVAVLAGGQSLIPVMNMRMARPRALIDLGGLDQLRFIEVADGCLRVGAMTRARDIERSELVRDRCPVLHEAITHVAHPVIRNRGTLGGSVAHADPAAEVPAILALLGGDVIAASTKGTRTIAAEDFFKGPFTTTLRPDEIITELRFYIPGSPAGAAFAEVVRRHGDFALAGAAAVATDGEERVVVFGVDRRPVVMSNPESLMIDEQISPTDDVHGSATYRRRLVHHLVSLVLRKARECRGT